MLINCRLCRGNGGDCVDWLQGVEVGSLEGGLGPDGDPDLAGVSGVGAEKGLDA